MIDINKAEKYFKNNGYADIIEESKPFCAHYTSMNVWGNEVIWLDISNPDKIAQKRYKLKTYKVDVEIGKSETDINAIKEKIIDSLYAKNLEMFGGITNREKLLNLTCNQLCEWHWLEDDGGKIFSETHKNGDVVYTAHLVKYAVVLDTDGNYEALITAITEMGYDASNPQHQLIGCGDYFGRAARSNSDCVNIWKYLTSPHHTNKPICIRGNHESILIDAIERRELTETDIYNGEHNTFASFLGRYPNQVKRDYYLQFDAAKVMINIGFYDWLKSLPWYFETKHYIFTHGFVPMDYFTHGLGLEEFGRDDWTIASWAKTPDYIRAFDEIKVKPNKTIVFGHWRAKELNERFARKWEEIDGDIYVDKERRLIGLDTTTALSYKVGGVILED